MASSKLADLNSTIVNWYVSRESTSSTFSRQALPMMWDFAEVHVLGENTGSFQNTLKMLAGSLASTAAGPSLL
ncbi:hypothetical protein BZL29_7680 [Mycobacterium kansasii]|uniref:Uncharacterized protein n=1 Tax=Mycobacterium kansasii TaxID=1768 RepID=A0A1V3WGR0_MYCKA|nr:hypothetical protein BZL29_7680 [Mycobacterium kansasii]